MTSSSLGYSFIENTDIIKEKLVKKIKPQKVVEKFTQPKQSKQSNSDYELDDESELADVDFSPPPKPISTGVEKTKDLEESLDREKQHDAEPFTKMTNEEASAYYQQYIPFSNPEFTYQGKNNNSRGGSSDLEKKLNYMIHLLEDQKDEKVGGITEEIVLYCFLGVFIIFVLDSFAKVGKYVR
jgi:hypothetical protein